MFNKAITIWKHFYIFSREFWMQSIQVLVSISICELVQRMFIWGWIVIVIDQIICDMEEIWLKEDKIWILNFLCHDLYTQLSENLTMLFLEKTLIFEKMFLKYKRYFSYMLLKGHIQVLWDTIFGRLKQKF